MSTGELYLFDDEEIPTGIVGVYAIYDFDGSCIYVGKSTCVSRRIKTHRKNKELIKNDPLNVIIFDYTEQLRELTHSDFEDLLSYFERVAIKNLEPVLNTHRPTISLEWVQGMSVGVQRIILNAFPPVNLRRAAL